MKQLTQTEAIAFGESRAWEHWTHLQRASLQLMQGCLCMPFDVFHESITKALGRPVFIHETANCKRLIEELTGLEGPMALQAIMQLLPRDKWSIVTFGLSDGGAAHG